MVAFVLAAHTNIDALAAKVGGGTARSQRRYSFGDDRDTTMCVYSITNRRNGKMYIGLTKGLAGARWRNHISSNARGVKACPLVSRAIDKYGVDAFAFAVIDIAESREQLAHKERFWIKELNTLAPQGYNLTTGGYVGADVSEETREKLRKSAGNRSTQWRGLQSEAKKAWFASDPERGKKAAERAKKHHTGRKQAPEQVEIRASLRRGVILSQGQRIKLARAHMNGKVIECSNGCFYMSSYEAAISTGVDKDKVGSVCTGKRKSTGGLAFWYRSAA